MSNFKRWNNLLQKLNAEKLSDKRASKLAVDFDAATARLFVLRAKCWPEILDKIFVLKYFIRSGAHETAGLAAESLERDLNHIRLAELLGTGNRSG